MKLEKYVSATEGNKSTREILDMFPKEEGRFYHGSFLNLDKLLSSNETGNIRAGEESRRLFKDIVFLTKDIGEATKYAGAGGTIHHVDATAVKYKDVAVELLNAKKAKSVNDNIFIALPDDIKIITKWVKEPDRKKNQPELYTDYYIEDRKN